MKKALTSIIAAAALLALVIPAAQATYDRSVPTRGSHAKVVKVSKAKVTKPVKITTPGRRLILIFPAPTVAPSVADDCVYSGNNCTDQELCITWGMNCDLVAAAQQPVEAVESQNPSG